MDANKLVLSTMHQLFADYKDLAQEVQKDPNDKTHFSFNPKWDPDNKEAFARFLKCGIVEVVPESNNKLYVLKSLKDNTPLVQNFVKLAAEELEPAVRVFNTLLPELDEDASESCFELLSSSLIELRRIHKDLANAVQADLTNGFPFTLKCQWVADNKVHFLTLLRYGFVQVIPETSGLCVLKDLNTSLVERFLTSLAEKATFLNALLAEQTEDESDEDDSDEDESETEE